MAAPAYPCSSGTDHSRLGPPLGHLRNSPVSFEILLRSAPRNCGQSVPAAARSRVETPNDPIPPMIQPRRVYTSHFTSVQNPPRRVQFLRRHTRRQTRLRLRHRFHLNGTARA